MAFLNWSFVFGVLTGTSLYMTLRWMCGSKKKKEIVFHNNSYDDCLLFSPDVNSLYCVNNKYNFSACEDITCCVCNYKKFLHLVKSATYSLDICLYLISSEEIAELILYLFKKGVFVRIILDYQMAREAINSKMHFFVKEHIPVKLIDNVYTMHNKFVIVDGKMLITGSFNWTKQGTCNNFENAVITYNINIVNKFKIYFQKIWVASKK